MEFATLEARLKTFEPPTKRSKAGWPHKSPSAEAVALAGFYYQPQKTGDDNVVCYLCDRYLDGWEEDDDPIEEHLQHSPECGYAIMARIAQGEQQDTSKMEDPTGKRLEDARRATFADWPHESKRGWVCKAEKMVEAGWHFTPTYECEDFTSCAYCKLSLDGWEPKDNPFEEHYRRAPECQFFVFAGTTAPSKRPKAKKGRTSRSSKASRTSKASTRLSTQSQTSTQGDIPDLDDSIDTSTTSLASNMSRASTASKTKRKAAGGTRSTRTKKAKTEPEPSPEPEVELEPQLAPELAVTDSVIHDSEDTIEHSTTSIGSRMSTASTATTKGKKNAGRPKKAPAKKTKATRTTRAKKAETEPAPESEMEAAEGQVQEGFARSQLEARADDVEEQAAPQEMHQPEIEAPEEALPDREATPVQSPTLAEKPPRQEADIVYPALQRAISGSPLQHKSSPFPHKSSPQPQVHSHTSPLAAFPTPPQMSPSAHSNSNSDIENAPPSSLPPSARPPPAQTQTQTHDPSSPTPALSSWIPADLELVFQTTPGGGSNANNFFDLAQEAEKLSEREQHMTVQEWVEYMAGMAERDLRQEAERLVTIFEKEGARAMGVLEAVECV